MEEVSKRGVECVDIAFLGLLRLELGDVIVIYRRQACERTHELHTHKNSFRAQKEELDGRRDVFVDKNQARLPVRPFSSHYARYAISESLQNNAKQVLVGW
eukprot:m.4048 g.4048  ORF g.4048 m.4048 type:complete len:101 (-) comp4395_c0_seq2:361-663(-)